MRKFMKYQSPLNRYTHNLSVDMEVEVDSKYHSIINEYFINYERERIDLINLNKVNSKIIKLNKRSEYDEFTAYMEEEDYE